MNEPVEARERAFPWPPVLAVAAVVAAALLAVAGRYGYHRDELYFLACGRRLTWGFVDQPPLTPALARVSETLFPGSLVGLRLWPALMAGALVVLTALTARELGARRLGQVAIAVVAACTPGFLLAGHLLATETFDLVAWAATALLVIRIVRAGHPRLWIAVGAIVGFGLENKWSIAFLVAGLLIGLAVTPERRVLATPWFVAGVAVAFAIWLPNLLWQADHAWPQVEMIRSIQRDSVGAGSAIAWLPLQVLITGVVPAVIWIAGLVRVLRNPEARRYRFLGIAYLVLAVVFALSAGDKFYYAAGLYVPLLGAGAVPLEGWLTRHRHGLARPLAYLGLVLTTLLVLPVALPIVPVTSLADTSVNDLNPEMGEQVGWPDLVREVARAWSAVPVADRSTAIVLTANYGEAGALERFGAGVGLPQPYSVHNTYWWWRTPPADTRTVVLVGWWPPYARRFFGSVVRAGAISNPYGVQNDEQGQPILIARDPVRPLPAIWPQMRSYG
ncbi:MAG: glycosyltransferase family 39 protein [Actinomycetota bacterium]